MENTFEKHFLDYFNEGDLSKPLTLGKENGLSFHWSSNLRTIELVKRNCLEDKKGQRRIIQLEKQLEHLKGIPVWLSSGARKKKTNLYHVYECYMDPRLNSMWQEFKNVSISLSYDLGPFSLVRSMKWFDEKIYAQFIYIKIIRSWMPKRHFRVGLEIPLELTKEKCPLIKFKANFHQVTEDGVLIQVHRSHLHHFKNDDDINFRQLHKNNEKTFDRKSECFSYGRWKSLIGDFNIRGEDFTRIVNNTLRTEERELVYLFIPFSVIDNDHFNKEEVSHSLDSAKKFICKLAA